MSVPPRPPAPSAMDGFRRLERTRAAARDAGATDAAPLATSLEPGRARRTRRVAGAIRIAGMLAIVAIIAGTSIGLATADPRAQSNERTAASTPAALNGPVQGPPAPVRESRAAAPMKATTSPKAGSAPKANTAPKATTAPKAAAAPAPAPATQAVDAVPTAAAAPVVAPVRALPFTGIEADVLRLLLAGAGLALLGMLVQIAGTPLPARARR